VPPRLGLILDKMMARRPEHRYQNCAELIADLEGLSLANPVLSFLAPEGSRPPRPPASAPPPRPAPTRPRAAADTVASHTAHARAGDADAPGYWYVRVTTPDGRLSTRKLTAAAVLDLIGKGELAAAAPASQHLDGGYRALASYPEFEPSLRKRDAKARADRKTEAFRAVYAELERDDRRRQWRRWFRNLYLSVGGWVKLLIYLALLGAACVGLYFGAVWGIHWLSARGEEFENYERPADTRVEHKGVR
jgi:eukaryotic-like serine/threonine-protein kinase